VKKEAAAVAANGAVVRVEQVGDTLKINKLSFTGFKHVYVIFGHLKHNYVWVGVV
jgi:hypothetical protein